MAGANAIQILRGNNIGSSSQILLPGQPVYDMETGYLRIGDGGTIASTQPIRAYYANSAGSASSASYATSSGSASTATRVEHNLRITVGGSTYVFNGSANTNVSISTSGGSSDYATNANYANYANTAYHVSGSNVSGSVSNARYADEADSVSSKLYFNGSGTNVGWNGASADVIYVPTTIGSIGQVWGVASNGRAAWIAQTEVPGTVDHANTANFATEAGCVSNSLTLIIPGSTVTYDGSRSLTANFISAIACVVGGATSNMVTTNTDQTINGTKTFSSDIKTNSGAYDMTIGGGAIVCDGRTFWFGGTGPAGSSGNVMLWSSSSLETGSGANGSTIGSSSRCRFITAWMDCTSTSTTLAIRTRSSGGTDLASAYGTNGQRVCISCLVPAGTGSYIYAPGRTSGTVYYSIMSL